MIPLRFEPIYQERVWGGRGLQTALGRALPEDKVIGESWEICDRPEAMSQVADGPDKGKTLRQLIENDPVSLLGPDYPADRPFPVLVKWLDCQQRLSLQVHPPAQIAPELGGEPKTENWYIVEAAPEAALLAGLKAGVTRETFEKGLRENALEPLVHRLPARPGGSLFVRSGRIHAIDAGNLILEIQQNSDTTYRVYDWGRVGLDGTPRQLHVEESLKSIDFADFEPDILQTSDAPGTVTVLADCAEFRIRKCVLESGTPLTFAAGEEARLLHCVSGLLSHAGGSVRGGENVLLPYSGEFAFTAEENTTVLVTDRFYAK